MRTIATLVIIVLLVVTTIGFLKDRDVYCYVYEKAPEQTNTPAQMLEANSPPAFALYVFDGSPRYEWFSP